MDLGLKDRLVLVTGSTAGIGKEIARQFVAQGARVIVNGRNPDKVAATVAELKDGAAVEPVGLAGDVSAIEFNGTTFYNRHGAARVRDLRHRAHAPVTAPHVAAQ